MPHLFDALNLGPLTLNNRIVVSPMCQYSANDGCANTWHLQHWSQLALSGAGMVVVEATAVQRNGRITHGCLGLYSDDCEAAMAQHLHAARRHGMPHVKFGIQIGHAGRKASAHLPWHGGDALADTEDAWPTIGPSAIPFSEGWPTPEAMTETQMAAMVDAFVDSAKRAVRLGFDSIELHMAHGYLLHAFMSPLSNKRTDAYGGSLENRMRLGLEIARAVRKVVPEHMALGARITGSDFHPEGWTPDDAATLTKELKKAGLDFVCVSSGGAVTGVKITIEPGYQVPLAEHVKKHVPDIAVRAVGLIVSPQQADDIISSGKADMVALARAILHNPRWPWHAAEQLGATLPDVPQYYRGQAQHWSGVKYLKP